MVKRINKKPPPQDSSGTPGLIVVGIGGSAGGLDAFREFLRNLPITTGMAFVFISHLSPDHKSQLTELLARQTKMLVSEAENGMLVESNQIYVIPSKVNMSILDGKLILIKQKASELIRMPINTFFISLAKEQKNKAIGIILSGTATDGTLGTEAIKAEGGITFAQDEESAKHYGMPQSAITAGCIDFVLPPQKIALKLQRIAKHPYISEFEFSKSKTEAKVDEIFYKERTKKDALEKIFAKLSLAKGLDFSHYKPSTIKRRILRRMALVQLHKLDDYEKLLIKNSDEVDKLNDDLLLSVTAFFRDSKVFDKLKKQILPTIFNNKTNDQAVRIWVPGCSSGEEAYSISICICEIIKTYEYANPVQIFATDVNQNNIDKARHGIYDKKIEDSVSPSRLRLYFTKVGNSYKVSKQLRKMCIFSKQNVFTDPPFSNVDLISCRNLLIYLQSVLQSRVFRNFHYSLCPDGFLLLGNSESIGSYSNLFKVHDNTLKFFIKKYSTIRSELKLDPSYFQPTKLINSTGIKTEEFKKNDLKSIIDNVIVTEFAPCGVLIDSNMEIIHFHGQTDRYLRHISGKPSLDLFKLACEGLHLPLHTAIYEAKKTKHKVKKELDEIKIDSSVDTVNVDLTVIPLTSGALKEDMFLVLFAEVSVGKSIKFLKNRQQSFKEENYIEAIQKELKETKIYLQTVIEEHESANEEVKTANEEILSSNEELQSTNEELETSKEELQSSNEELSTTNQELLNRNVEVSLLNNDLINLLTCINMPVVMMDTDLVIRRITPQTDKVLNIIPTDIGRSISKIKLNIDIPDFEKILLVVIESMQPRIFDINDKNENSYSVYVRPYCTMDNKIDGVIAIFIDITDRLKAQQLVEKARIYAECIVETIREPLLVLNSDLNVISANTAFYQQFQVNPGNTPGKLIYDLGNRQWDIPALRLLLEEIVPNKSTIDDYEVTYFCDNIGEKTLLLNARHLLETNMILITIKDITESREVHEREHLTNCVLNCINRKDSTEKIICNIIQLIRESTKIEAIGVRLKEGDDFPYYQTRGFSEQFIKMECYLCERNKAGNIVCDTHGNPILDCMCGNILRGRTDTKFSCFTEGGSFWSNCTTDLLATTTEKERLTHTRNRCNSEGYESVALIPLRSDDEIIGLLQFNDHRKDKFTLERINFFEGLGVSIGMSLARNKANEKILSLSKFPSENPSPVLRIALDGKLLYHNNACINLPGKLYLRVGKTVPPVLMDIVKQAKEGEMINEELMLEEYTYLFYCTLIADSNYINLYAVNITEFRQTEKDLLKTKIFLDTVVDMSPFAMWVSDKEGTLIKTNSALRKLLNTSNDKLIGKYNVLKDLNLRKQGLQAKVENVFKRHESILFNLHWQAENAGEDILNKAPDLYIYASMFPILNIHGELTNVVCQWIDITEQTMSKEKLKKQNLKLEHLATFDSLTGIANRYTFQKSGNLVFQTAKRYGRKFAILLADIDNFKWINDQYGHDVGDLVLQSTATIINQNLRKGDLLSRLGGDEFGIVLSEIGNVNDAGIAAEKILKLFTKQIEINGNLINCSVSVGIACFSAENAKNIDTFDMLLKQADIAMYKAKESGRNCFDFFSRQLRAEYYERQEIEYELKRALKTNEFYLLYQPIIDMNGSSIVGVEALLRMPNSSNLGEIKPTVFIPIAERLNIIQNIGLWVFEKVCSDINKWTKKGIKELFYSINVSPKQMNMENFWRNFKSILFESNTDPKLLELEITETMFGADFDIYIDEWLNNFKKLQLKLSIDDFGTGYSSLSRLGVLPISTIKIDGSFVSNIGKSEKHDSLVKNIIRLAESLSAKTIAECVETKEQVDFLLKNGCSYAQGYYYYKPMTAEKFLSCIQ